MSSVHTWMTPLPGDVDQNTSVPLNLSNPGFLSESGVNREGQGESLGAVYTQHSNGEITFQQKDYAQHIRPISISKERVKKPWLPATEKEISELRAVNSALGWISSQGQCMAVLKRRSSSGITDCKSLFDHLISLGSGGTLDDKRTAIDVAIIRQCILRCSLEPRWCPTGHMLADGLTKDK